MNLTYTLVITLSVLSVAAQTKTTSLDNQELWHEIKNDYSGFRAKANSVITKLAKANRRGYISAVQALGNQTILPEIFNSQVVATLLSAVPIISKECNVLIELEYHVAPEDNMFGEGHGIAIIKKILGIKASGESFNTSTQSTSDIISSCM